MGSPPRKYSREAMRKMKRKDIIRTEDKMKELEELFNFALEIFDKSQTRELAFGGIVEIDTPCSCGCTFIVEVYSEGVFRCLECGNKR